jgi:hypothetical protein
LEGRKRYSSSPCPEIGDTRKTQVFAGAVSSGPLLLFRKSFFFVSDNLEGPNTPVASRAETPCDARSPAAPGKQRCTPSSSCSASGGRQRRSQKRCRVHRPDDFLKVNNKLLFIIKSTPQHNKTGGFSAGFAAGFLSYQRVTSSTPAGRRTGATLRVVPGESLPLLARTLPS